VSRIVYSWIQRAGSWDSLTGGQGLLVPWGEKKVENGVGYLAVRLPYIGVDLGDWISGLPYLRVTAERVVIAFLIQTL